MGIVHQVGQRVKEERLKQGLTQDQLAGLAGLSRTYVSFLEIAYRSPSISALDKIANALEIELRELFTFQSSNGD